MTATIISKSKRESELQDTIMSLFQQCGHKTINEDLNKEHDNVLQEHEYLILSPLDNLTKGLTHYIKKFNQHILKDPLLLSKYTEQELIDKIQYEFIKSYDASSYLDIYRLVFLEFSDKRTIELEGKPYQFNLINFQKPVENEIFVIKEKRIQKTNGGYEKPDFAIYMNGIPVFAIEVKTRKAGLPEAFRDYQTKTTYHKFIGCIGTDLEHTFIAMDPTAPSYFLWKAYGVNKNPHMIGNSNFEELLCEILPSGNGANGLLFYIQNCSFVLENETGDKIINHRCQQYYTTRKLDIILKNIQTAKDDGKRDALIKEVVKHAQRSGKSITILSLVNLLATKYPTLFTKIYIFVPDLTILSVLKKAFGKQAIPGTGKPLQVIDKIKNYEKTIERKENGLTVYLMNIQKSRIDNKTYKDNDALIIIDEVHTHQNGLGAESRDINFPMASYISFTATPRFKSHSGDLIDVTATTYGKTPIGVNEVEYLDEFNMTDALELGIVARLRYEKAKIAEEWDKERSAEVEIELNESARRKIESDYETKEHVYIREENIIRDAKLRLDSGLISQQEYNDIAENAYEQALYLIQSKLIKQANSVTAFNIMRNMVADKIEFVIKDMMVKRESVMLEGRDNKLPFKNKALWFVHDTNTAKTIIRKIKEISNSEENIYKGIRFGIDYSDNGLYEERDASQNTQKEVDALNGKYFYGNGVLNDFESQEEYAIDVLIVVGKYLMGYDLGTLMTVYLDTEVREPAKFFQMATRPITTYPNKKLGYLVDMSMGESNYDTFLTSIKYYDSNNHMKTFVLKREDIETEQEIIEQNLQFISSYIFEVNSEKELFSNKVEYYVDILMNKDPSDQMSFFKRLKNIYSSFNNLVTPENYRIYLNTFGFYLAVGKLYYKEMFNKEEAERLIFDPVFIYNVIEEAFESLGVKSFDDLAKYVIVGNKNRDFRAEKDFDGEFEGQSGDSLSFIDNHGDEDRGVSSIYEWLSGNSHKLDESIERQIRNKKKEESGGEIEKEIEKDFNGNEMLYWTYKDFMEKLKVSGEYPKLSEQGEVVFSEMMKDILGSIVDRVWSDIIPRIQTLGDTDIDVAINDSYIRTENSHNKVSGYVKKVENEKDEYEITQTYMNLFIKNGASINSDLKDAIKLSVEVQRESSI